MIIENLVAWIRRHFNSGGAEHPELLGFPSQLPGPPAVALARRLARLRSDIEIDALETKFDMRDGGLAVRAWFLVGTEHLPPDLERSLSRTIEALRTGDPLIPRVFYLSTSYRMPTQRIAALLGLPRRRVRRLLIAAIAALDRLEQ
jgi:hypothetical protein